MSNDKYEKMVRYVQVLLKKTVENGCEEAEAAAALMKAHELMAKYNIEESSLEGKSSEDVKAIRCTHKWNAKWRTQLANVIGKNFRCKVFRTGGIMTMYGLEKDAQMAVGVFNSAYAFIYRRAMYHYDRAYAEARPTKGIMASYAMGFINGLSSALNKQSQELMVVMPGLVVQQYEEMSKDFKTYAANVNQRLDAYGAAVAAEGRRDGKKFFDNKRLEG